MKRDNPMTSPVPARHARYVLGTLGTALHGQTGFPQSDVEDDFLRARRRQVAARLAARLRHQPDSATRLLPLSEVTGALGNHGERRLGLQSIPLATIAGTLDPRRDFDNHFRPTSNLVRARWERLALAQRRGEPIPPIEVYRVGGQHFVVDGLHRVSIAATAHQKMIDAYITEVLVNSPTRHGNPAA